MQPQSVLLVFGWRSSNAAGGGFPALNTSADPRPCRWQLPQQSCCWDCPAIFCAEHSRLFRLETARPGVMLGCGDPGLSLENAAGPSCLARLADSPPAPAPPHPIIAASTSLPPPPPPVSTTSSHTAFSVLAPNCAASAAPAAAAATVAAVGWVHAVAAVSNPRGSDGDGAIGGGVNFWVYDSDEEEGSGTERAGVSLAASSVQPAGQPLLYPGDRRRRRWRLQQLPYNTGPIVQVSVGELHTLALDVTGSVWVWSADGDGQCGTVAATAAAAAPPPATMPTVDATSATPAGAPGHCGSVTSSGRALSTGVVAASGRPLRISHVPIPVQVRQVTCGARHSLAVDCRGGVWAWGWNAYGQCGAATLAGGGAGARAAVGAPVRVQGGDLGGVPAVAVAAGLGHSLALTEAGQVVAWGWNDARQCGPVGSWATAIAAADGATGGADADAPSFLAEPQLVPILRPPAGGGDRVGDGALGPGGRTRCGQKRGREGCSGAAAAIDVFDEPPGSLSGSWEGRRATAPGGCDSLIHGGDGDELKEEEDEEEDIIKISCGGRHSLALASSGRLYGWGSNARGQLGPACAMRICTGPQLLLPAPCLAALLPPLPFGCEDRNAPDLDLGSELDPVRSGSASHLRASARGGRVAGRLAGQSQTGGGMLSPLHDEAWGPPNVAGVFLAFDSGLEDGAMATRETVGVEIKGRIGARGVGATQDKRVQAPGVGGGGGVMSLSGQKAASVLRSAKSGPVLVVVDMEGGWGHTVVRCASCQLDVGVMDA